MTTQESTTVRAQNHNFDGDFTADGRPWETVASSCSNCFCLLYDDDIGDQCPSCKQNIHVNQELENMRLEDERRLNPPHDYSVYDFKWIR